MAIIVVIGRGLGKTNGSGRRLSLVEVEAGGGGLLTSLGKAVGRGHWMRLTAVVVAESLSLLLGAWCHRWEITVAAGCSMSSGSSLPLLRAH